MPRDILLKKKIPIDKGNTRVTLTPRTLSGFPSVIAADKHFKTLQRLSRNLKSIINNFKFRCLLFSVELCLVTHSVPYLPQFLTQLAKGVFNFSAHCQTITRKMLKIMQSIQ